MGLTSNFKDVADRIFYIIEIAQPDLGLADVFYGDQLQVPRVPTACVESGTSTETLVGAPRRIEAQFTNYVLLYHGRVGDTQVSRQEVDALAASVRTLLNADPIVSVGNTTDSIVIHGFVNKMDPGYATRAGVLMHATRITHLSESRYNL